MQATGIAIAVVIEFAARMQLGKDHLHAAYAQLFVDAHRDAAAVILHGDGVVFVQGHAHLVCITVGCLIHSVVHDLPKDVVQASNAGRADIHARSHTHSLQAFHDLDVAYAVVLGHPLPPLDKNCYVLPYTV